MQPNILYKSLIVFAVISQTIIILFVVLDQPSHGNQIKYLVDEFITQSGVTNPVTAVLLNFRAYDTLIEFAVFLCVAIAVFPNLPTPVAGHFSLRAESQLLKICKTFIPISVVFAGYLLWIGANKPGGAFQAAALLAGCLVLVSLTNTENFFPYGRTIRLILTSGMFAFLSVSAYTLVVGLDLLQLPPLSAGVIILFIEFCATFAIALSLFLCFESIYREQN